MFKATTAFVDTIKMFKDNKGVVMPLFTTIKNNLITFWLRYRLDAYDIHVWTV